MRALPQHTDLPLILADQQSGGHWDAQKSRPPALGGQSPASPQRLMRRLCFWLKTGKTRPPSSFKRLEYRAVHWKGKAEEGGDWRRNLQDHRPLTEGREESCFLFLKFSLSAFPLVPAPVAHPWNPYNWEAETGGSQVQGLPRVQDDFKISLVNLAVLKYPQGPTVSKATEHPSLR